MKEKLKEYIKLNLKKESFLDKIKNKLFKDEITEEELFYDFEDLSFSSGLCKNKIDTYIEEEREENNFRKLLFQMIDERNLKDSDVYNKVHLDRRLFSKIRNDKDYHPKKQTIILLGLSLELKEQEIEKLLMSASYALPKNNYFDLIIRFCFKEGIYDVIKINELLDSYNCKLLEV